MYVSPNHFGRDASSGSDIQLIRAAHTFEGRKLLPKVTGRVSFEQVGNLCRAKPRWSRYEDRDVVPVGFHFENGQSVPIITTGLDQPFGLRLHVAREDFPPIFGNPDEVIGDMVMHRVLLVCRLLMT